MRGKNSPVETLAAFQPVLGLNAAARKTDVVSDVGDARYGDEIESLNEEAETLRKYEERTKIRDVSVDEIKSAEGESDFKFGESLRITWLSHQRADKELSLIMNAKEKDFPGGYRIAKDGVLEREIRLPPPCPVKWVPVVPDGQSMRNMTWKRWLFLQVHVGVQGAHRSAPNTYTLLSRQCWWRTMKVDIEN